MKTGKTRQMVEANMEAADTAEDIAAVLEGIEHMLTAHPDGLDLKIVKRANHGPRVHVRVGFVEAAAGELDAARQNIALAFPFVPGEDDDPDQTSLDLGVGGDEDEDA